MSKTHSQWSASASDRNMACPGSLALIAKNKLESTTSIYAAWGPGMHEINEISLREGIPPPAMLGKQMQIDGFAIEADEDMIEAAQVCVDYVNELKAKPGAVLWIEERFDLSPLGFPLEAGGTSDAVAWLPEELTIEIVDFKGGKGKIVEIADNTQLAHYGLGALVKHPELKAKKVRMTVIQPRIEHKDGVIRSAEVHVSDLVDFANDIKVAMDRSVLAIDTYARAETEPWEESFLHPGDHCQFCPAAGQCPALRKKAQEMVNLHWEDDIPVVQAGSAANDPATVERDLDVIDLLEQWIASRRAYAHQLAEGGHQFANWTLVEKHGHRKWNDQDSLAADKIAVATGLASIELFTHKLKSPAQVEKVLGKGGREKIADLFHIPSIGSDLVRRSKAASRQPAVTLVDAFFNAN